MPKPIIFYTKFMIFAIGSWAKSLYSRRKHIVALWRCEPPFDGLECCIAKSLTAKVNKPSKLRHSLFVRGSHWVLRRLLIKYVSKVRGELCDSRKLYIASVTIIQRAGNSTPQIKYAKKCRKLFICVDTDSLWWSFLALILIHIHQTWHHWINFL